MPRTTVVDDEGGHDRADVVPVGELRNAIETDQLVLHYQPKATLVSGRVQAVEALVRWRHPRHGLLYPDRFVPLAEQTGMIDELTDWVLDRALGDLRGLGPKAAHITMAVNASAHDLHRPDFADRVNRALAGAQIAPERMVVEFTETALLSDGADARVGLSRLDALGVKVSIDDFGCGRMKFGYKTPIGGLTPASYLSTFPLHELKIDRSFIGDMLVNPDHAAIVRSIVDLGHHLRLRVVGEGVESDVVWEILQALGCDSAQGYVLARPMPFEELGHWLENSAQESHGLVEDSVLATSAVYAHHR